VEALQSCDPGRLTRSLGAEPAFGSSYVITVTTSEVAEKHDTGLLRPSRLRFSTQANNPTIRTKTTHRQLYLPHAAWPVEHPNHRKRSARTKITGLLVNSASNR
jgi:hypothetical protein